MTLKGPEKEANLENSEQKERQCQDGDEKAGVWLLTGRRRKTGSARRKVEMETVDGTSLLWQRHKHENENKR